MRIALCLSGEPRTWRQCIASQQALVRGHQVTTYLHLWDEIPEAEVRDLCDAYQPVECLVTPRPDFSVEKRRLAERGGTMPPFTTFDMFYGVAQALRAALDAAPPFDAVVRLRYDSCFDDHLDPARLAGWLTPPAIIVPDGWRPDGGYNDQFAFGPPSLMRLYAAFINWLPHGLGAYPYDVFQPEKALRFYLDRIMGLPVREAPLRVTLRRTGQEGRTYAELQDSPTVYARKAAAWRDYAQNNLPPDLLPRLDFQHYAEVPLMMETRLAAETGGWPPEQRHALLHQPWPERILAIDRHLLAHANFDGAPLSQPVTLDERVYENIRLYCAALLNQMPRSDALEPDSVIVHALSCNKDDAIQAGEWLKRQGLDGVGMLEARLDRLTVLATALRYGDPFRRRFIPYGWGVR